MAMSLTEYFQAQRQAYDKVYTWASASYTAKPISKLHDQD
jgi:hypothetical protein